MNSYDIFGIGAALVDTEISITDEDLQLLGVSKGLMSLVDESQMMHSIHHLREHLFHSHRACGGSAANSLIAASYFGCRTFFTCKVADDDDGNFFLSSLQQAGIEHNSNGQLRSGITGKCLVLVTPDAERTMNTSLCISQTLSTENLHSEALTHSRYLYIEGYLVTSPSGKAAAQRCREIATQTDTLITASLSDPGIVTHFRKEMMEMLGDWIDLLFCNEAEACAWTDTDSLESAAQKLTHTAKQFAITRGSQGALLFDGESFIEIGAPEVTAVDTNGAGDLFAGAFLSAICQGKSFAEAGEFACIAASEVVKQFGPRLPESGYRSLREAFLGVPA